MGHLMLDLYGTKETTDEVKEAEGVTLDQQASTVRGRREDTYRRHGRDILEKGMGRFMYKERKSPRSKHTLNAPSPTSQRGIEYSVGKQLVWKSIKFFSRVFVMHLLEFENPVFCFLIPNFKFLQVVFTPTHREMLIVNNACGGIRRDRGGDAEDKDETVDREEVLTRIFEEGRRIE
ncbi:hypothetical protein E3N88_00110 [Mikania micrantha]|uniref:Uncharacterized protein n=1 Tax=Mikania micrantha TaxID=192012 RepID=A0A5N6PX49_9ASTR|nr:hypothetical protein E3N88_00110 [Mikania micrantha]